jgi:hypothetical protein
LFLSRLKRKNESRRGQRTQRTPAITTINPCSFSSCRTPVNNVPLVAVKENVGCSRCSNSCSCRRSNSESCQLSTPAALPLLRSPTVVRQVSYHWKTVQRFTLKSQRQQSLSRDFGTQASFDEFDAEKAPVRCEVIQKTQLDCDVVEKTSANVESRYQSSIRAVGNSLRNSFRKRASSVTMKPTPHLTTSKTFSTTVSLNVSPSPSVHKPGVNVIRNFFLGAEGAAK